MPTQPPRTPPAFLISHADTAILSAVGRYHCLTALQVTTLLYARASLTWVQTKLKKLHAAGYLTRDRIPTRPTQGSAPLYYALSRTGFAHLTSLGQPAPGATRPYQVHEYSYLFLAHLLAVNEVLIAAELVCRQVPQLQLTRLLHDQELKRQPVFITDRGTRRAVILDGFLDFAVHTEPGYRAPLCLELDRGTERQQDVRTKIRALVQFSQGPYQAAFGRQSLTICLIASPGADRLGSLMAWTRAELSELGVTPEEADIFRLGAFPLDWYVPETQRPSPIALFLEPHWYRVTDDAPVALFTGL
jgi:hypothetical protein